MALQRQNSVIDKQQETDVHQDHKENAKGFTLRRAGIPNVEHKEYIAQVSKYAADNSYKAITLKDQKDSVDQSCNKNPAEKFSIKKILFHKLTSLLLDS